MSDQTFYFLIGVLTTIYCTNEKVHTAIDVAIVTVRDKVRGVFSKKKPTPSPADIPDIERYISEGSPVILVNLTPHEVVVETEEGEPLVLPPSGTVARVRTPNASAGFLRLPDGRRIKTTRSSLGEVVGLPEPELGVVYVVSAHTRISVKNRHDLFSPGDLRQDSAGKPVSCKGLRVN